jgi:hypothetical protein
MNKNTVQPKMNRKQAKILWNNLTPKQRQEFNEMYEKLNKGELILKNVMVDDNEQIQRIVLDPKDKPGKPTKPFMKHFNVKD